MIARLVVDAAADPPLGATERTIAALAPDAVLRGLGRAALTHPRAKLVIEVPDEQVRAALAQAAEKLGVEIPIAITTFASGESTDVLRLLPSELVATSPATHVITVAGALERARVLFAAAGDTVGHLVTRSGPKTRAWVALWGGASGAVVERETTVEELVAGGGARLLLVLPAGHAIARRARTSLTVWLRRARSACSSCGICAPACAEGVPVPELLRMLVAGGAARVRADRLSAAAACTSCGACDLACPQAISPARVIAEVGLRLREGGVRAQAKPRRIPRLDPERALARLGLTRYRYELPSEIASN